MKYSTLLQLISENPILMDTVRHQLETDRDEILNLVTPDWQDRLHNDSLFQRYRDLKVVFSNNTLYRYIKLQPIANKSDDSIKILVAGYFTIYKVNRDNKIKIFFVPKECPPLMEIGQAFTPKGFDYSPKAKMSVDSCGYASCRDCPRYAKMYQVPIDDKNPWWCVRNTKIFNGDCVKNVFRHTIERDLEGTTFLAILTLHIDTRQYYGENFKTVKMIGCVKNMILFKEHALEPKSDKEHDIFFDVRIGDTASATANVIDDSSSHREKEDGAKEATDKYSFCMGKPSSSNQFIRFTPHESFNDMEYVANEGEEDDTDIKCIPTFHKNGKDENVNEFVVEKVDQIQFD